MNNTDLITILGNLSRSLQSVEHLVGGISYLTGIVLVFLGLMKLKKSGARSQEGGFSTAAYFIAGGALIFLPSAYKVASNTLFGSNSILEYAHYNSWSLNDSVGILLQTAGLIWFVRGCIVMVQASKPGHQEGSKGFLFIFAGIMAMNFAYTIDAVNFMIKHLTDLSLTVTSVTGQ